MSFANRVAEYRMRLTPADRALVALIEGDPVGASLGSAGSLAHRAGVHGATAGRLAKKLGFADWRGLAGALRAEHILKSRGRPVEPAATAATLDGASALGSIAVGTLPGETRGLMALQGSLQSGRDPEAALESAFSMLSRMANRAATIIAALDNPNGGSAVDAAARRLCDAGVVWIAAREDFAAISELLRIRLRRYKLNVTLLAENEVDRLATASSKDVLLELAGNAPQFRFKGLRRCAVAQGLTVVLIGPLLTSESDPPPDVHIAIPAGTSGDAVMVGHVLGVVALASTVMTLRASALPS